MLDKAYHIAKDLGMTTHVGNVLSSDVFYSNYGEKNIELGKWGVKAVEMEAAALYYLAAQHHVDALAIILFQTVWLIQMRIQPLKNVKILSQI